MRSGEHQLFDAHMAVGRVRAEQTAYVAALAKAMAPWIRATARMGVTFSEAAARLRKFGDAMERAGDAQRIARGLPWDVDTVRAELAALELRGASRQQAERYLNLCARAGAHPSAARRAAGR